MTLIDTHCHLTTLSESELPAVLERAAEAGVTKMLCVGASEGIKSAKQAIALSRAHDNIWASVGVHPHDAGEITDITCLEGYLEEPKLVAIGETGLDFYRDWAPQDKQHELFENTIHFAKRVAKPLIIHCRDAEEETFETLVRLGAKEVGGVFHCYAGNAEFAVRLKEINFLVSFTGNITFKKADVFRETVRRIPLEQIMLETDCPYMAPEPHRGGPSEPMHVKNIAEKIAEIHGVTTEEIAQATSNNARHLFGI